ncbi:hypothetical protein P5V15_007603 [Pogonomyrmex californicus]
MYTTRRHLFVLAKTCKRILMQSSYENVLLREIDRYWNNATRVQTYCQIAINAKSNQTNVSVINDVQQMLDEFLSNSENEKLLQMLESELNVMRHNAERIPENLRPIDWLTLLKLTSWKQKRKYLDYLWHNERSKENRRKKKELKRIQWLATKAEAAIEEKKNIEEEIKYGLTNNSLFLRIYKRVMNQYLNNKLIQAIMFEPKIIFDCSYENYMTYFEIHNCAKQLSLAFARNRAHVDPMCLYFCNLNKDGMLIQYFYSNMPNLLDDDFPAIVTSQSYLDLFPRDQLLYLTPHCKTDLTEYDSDVIYIIGAIVDKSNKEPLSLAKAEKEGIRVAKLPIEKYFEWGSCSRKSFTLDQMMKIMLDLRYTGNWKKALQHIPIRKLKRTKSVY